MLADPFFVRAVPAKVLALMKTPQYRDRVTSDPHFKDYPTFLKNAQANLKLLATPACPSASARTPGRRTVSAATASTGSWR